jgi:hypothetical protein
MGAATNKGRLLLIKVWNINRKSCDEMVRERAIDMLHRAFESPEEMISYFKDHGIEYHN